MKIEVENTKLWHCLKRKYWKRFLNYKAWLYWSCGQDNFVGKLTGKCHFQELYFYILGISIKFWGHIEPIVKRLWLECIGFWQIWVLNYQMNVWYYIYNFTVQFGQNTAEIKHRAQQYHCLFFTIKDCFGQHCEKCKVQEWIKRWKWGSILTIVLFLMMRMMMMIRTMMTTIKTSLP